MVTAKDDLLHRCQKREERVCILEFELKERETSEATLWSHVDKVDLHQAQTQSMLEAKNHELAQIANRIPSLKAALARNNVQLLSTRAKAQTVQSQSIEATRLADLAFTRDGELSHPLSSGFAIDLCRR